MSRSFYVKLAWTGIRKNKRLYLPYILTCVGMVMMFYIVCFLSVSPILATMPGGDVVLSMLQLGTWVVGFFALIFLFYTNSFLMRRRKKEFGLYNILGMGKRNLARILIWENLIIAFIAIAGGLIAGILFSKVAELGMVNILSADVSFSLTVDLRTIWSVLVLFSVIFLLIFLNSLRQIHLSKPIELLHSENVGEKPPRANWVLAVLGVLLLGGAYWLAVTIQDPVSALVWFFVAVLMVIAATYLLFIAGSVVLCKLLQKRKKYYYKPNHFVSVSSMVYRMKRNGAGLASICILCTMVLVMLSSTVCLYVGKEENLRTRYPRNIMVNAVVEDPAFLHSDAQMQLCEKLEQTAREKGQQPENILNYAYVSFGACVKDSVIDTDLFYADASMSDFEDLWQIFVFSIEDYNRIMNLQQTLSDGQVLMYTTKQEYTQSTVTIGDMAPLTVQQAAEGFIGNSIDAMQIFPSMFLFVSDFDSMAEMLTSLPGANGADLAELEWFYGFDLSCDSQEQIEIYQSVENVLQQSGYPDQQTLSYVRGDSAAQERDSFFGLHGGFFFLGILLGIVFVFAAVLIMYYKQVSEGYEDQARFDIMQKVGMTKREIRRSVNSQVLTVFFLPLITAGIHLAFAFPLVYKLLMLFGLINLKLLILVTVICYLIFALFYMLVYRITSGAYYSIASAGEIRCS